MLLFIFLGFLIGFVLSLRRVQRPVRVMVLGSVLGVVSLALMLGPGSAPIEGIGSLLNFAFFVLGPLSIVLIAAIGASFGAAAGASVVWVKQWQIRWLYWALGVTLVGIAATVTLPPVVQTQMAKIKLAKDRKVRADAIMRADFKGTIAGHSVAFPATPRLHLFDDCAPGVRVATYGCSTSLTNPVNILTHPKEVLLHERVDPISFRTIRIDAIEKDCRNTGDYCLTKKKVDLWCNEIRPDQKDSIWCRDAPPIRFALQTDATPIRTYFEDDPDLASRYGATPLGMGQVRCAYNADASYMDRLRSTCNLSFELDDGIKVTLSTTREQILYNDPALTETIDMIPEYWAALRLAR
ncbi:MAG: hypothetical protein AAGJ09_06245 [Pseudomonadota bacterium]